MFQTTRIYILILRVDRVFHVLKVIYFTGKFQYLILHHKFNNENETFSLKKAIHFWYTEYLYVDLTAIVFFSSII